MCGIDKIVIICLCGVIGGFFSFVGNCVVMIGVLGLFCVRSGFSWDLGWKFIRYGDLFDYFFERFCNVLLSMFLNIGLLVRLFVVDDIFVYLFLMLWWGDMWLLNYNMNLR